jgi:hypothetical protein
MVPDVNNPHNGLATSWPGIRKVKSLEVAACKEGKIWPRAYFKCKQRPRKPKTQHSLATSHTYLMSRA